MFVRCLYSTEQTKTKCLKINAVQQKLMQQFLLKKGDFSKFVNTAIKDSDFVAPVEGSREKQNTRPFFREISSADEIYLGRKSYYTVKGFFFRENEKIFGFNGNKIINPESELKDTIYFGLRRCDLNGIYHQDIVFLDENEDPFYKARRDASLLIGYHCREGDDYCFCNSMELVDFFDLMFYDKGENYAVETGSEKGNSFVKKYSKFFTKADNAVSDEDRKTVNRKKLNTADIKDDYDNDDWKKGSDICVSCGACNFLCMNCHCFDFEDDVEFDLKAGSRIRKPASCQLRSFTRVAGNHVFRNERNARFKHRIYHQLQYFRERHNVQFCTGCGRCIEGCPVRIDWVEIINEMKK
ncbi:hypothetical protein GF323_02825 [Candidatus Woesearchaeota archaeon]|nr:hypothetical protein [Candidatus Woesearchaeota archaeon]